MSRGFPIHLRKRYLPTKKFPPYAFLPGVQVHPNAKGGYRFQVADPEVGPIVLSVPEKSEALCFALDLFNHEYFWESHVYLEALWNAHDRQGSVAEFLKGFIKLSAVGVKLKTEEFGPAEMHLKNARAHFKTVIEKEGSVFLGFDLEELLVEMHSLSHNEAFGSQQVLFEIHPEWSPKDSRETKL